MICHTPDKPAGRSIDHSSPVEAAAFSPDGTRALTIGEDGGIQVWDARTWMPLARISNPDFAPLRFAQFNPDNRFVASWGYWWEGNPAWWDVESGRLVSTIADPEHDFEGADWRPDSQQLLSASRRGDVALWNASSSGRPTALLPHASPITAALYGPDGRTLLAATEDGAVLVWDLGRGNEP